MPTNDFVRGAMSELGVVVNDDPTRIIEEESTGARTQSQANKLRNIVKGIVNKRQQNGTDER